MKRFIAVAALLILLCGCSSAEEEHIHNFYYPRVEYTQNEANSVITAERREETRYFSTVEILNAYVNGPNDLMLRSPFPSGLEIRSVYIMADTVYLTVNDVMSTLTGMELVLACTCLGQTAIDITDVQIAQISCETAKLDGMNVFTVSSDTVYYLDPVPDETAGPTTE